MSRMIWVSRSCASSTPSSARRRSSSRSPRRTPNTHRMAVVRRGGSVTLGGRRVPARRPRVRAVDGSGELAVSTYELFSASEIVGQFALERMLSGLFTCRLGSAWSRSARLSPSPRRPRRGRRSNARPRSCAIDCAASLPAIRTDSILFLPELLARPHVCAVFFEPVRR